MLSVEGLVSGADSGIADEVSGAGHCAHDETVSEVVKLRNGETLFLVRTSETS